MYVNKAPNSPTVSDDDTVDNCPLPADPEGGGDQDPGRVPTTRDILYLATAVIHADGAGLYKRPADVSYTNKHIPTIVSATHPTQTHVVTMFGREVTVTCTATSYTWSWGDGTPDLTTTSPGTPWHTGMNPNTDPALIRHYYTPPNGWRSRFDGPYPDATRTITLTTTWAGTATNPFTGETQTINSLVTTKETTGPFPPGPPHHLKHRHLGRKTRPLKHHQAVHAPGTTHAPANAAGPRTQRCAAPERSTGEGTPAS